MAFTAKDVQTLREMTGVGMMDCKKALTASYGDMDKAVEFLREKGLAASQKKASRIAAEGIVCACVLDNGVAAMAEVNIETDFAAKNPDFQKFAEDITKVVAEKNPSTVEELMEMNYPGTNNTVAEIRQERVLVIGENIQIRRFARFDSGLTVPYIHMGGKIGVLINMEVSDGLDKEKVIELGKDLAMQTAAMRPIYLDSSSVDADEIAKEESIQLAKAMEENKAKNLPEDKAMQIAKNMVKGRMNKFFEEICLMNQPFVKENKLSVEKYIGQVAKELGGDIKVKAFVRFERGEGIEKKSDNFADEVASMIK